MACGGCRSRQDVLRGMIKRQQQQTVSPSQAIRRVAVVGQHAARDAGRVIRSVLPTRRPR